LQAVYSSLHLRGSGIREISACGTSESSKFLLRNPESWALEYRIQLKESGIPLTIAIRKPYSTDQESGIHSVEIQNPFLTWGNLIALGADP